MRLKLQAQGFTLIELMMAISVVVILALIAMPSYLNRIVQTQVKESLSIADVAKQAVSNYYNQLHVLPKDNAAAGLPPPDKFVGNFVAALTVHQGAIDIKFGNLSNSKLTGKTLTLRPALVEGYPQVPIAWVCGQAAVPPNMTTKADNATDVPLAFLPLSCRNLGAVK